ncbi:hypothetical protein RJ639_044419 [Escallonia herrerae]|uniref:Protein DETOXIFICATION n=1 Tax=Escallonia herrerae TaxID=1293975 RepID=A0AA88WB47_9ASTE|nr:hypothetical protein RJ639_044419 [Escallonia herrerae]
MGSAAKKDEEEEALHHQPLLVARKELQVEEEENLRDLKRRVWVESKKLWHIVGPSIFFRIASNSMNIVTQVFAGHLGKLELASISIANNVIVGFNFGLLLHFGVVGAAIALDVSWWVLIRFIISKIAVIRARVRVANELGAGHGKAAKFATKVSVVQSTIVGLFFCALTVIFRGKLSLIFSSSTEILEAVDKLSYLLATSILLNSVQPVLSGVAVGSGWQTWVAYINVGCYYLIGLPVGIILGWILHLGVEGIWGGMIFGGTALQTIVLAMITVHCNWEKELLPPPPPPPPLSPPLSPPKLPPKSPVAGWISTASPDELTARTVDASKSGKTLARIPLKSHFCCCLGANTPGFDLVLKKHRVVQSVEAAA